MRAVLLEVHVGIQRMRLASSAWKDSRRVVFKIHVSAPMSGHGSTQCSKMLLEEMAMKDPAASRKECMSGLLDILLDPLGTG